MKDKPRGWYTGIVDLIEVIENYKKITDNDIYFLFDERFKKDVAEKLKRYFDSINKACKCLTKNQKKNYSIEHFVSSNKKISFSNLQLILECLNYPFPLNFIKTISTCHGAWNNLSNSILNPRLPFDFKNENGVRVISSILHDGGITSELNPHFTSSYLYFRRLFKYNIEMVLGKLKNKSSDPKSFECIMLPKIVGIIFVYGIGLNSGKKVITNPKIPEYIFNLSPELKWCFISQAIDEDGTIENKARRIQIHHSIDTSCDRNSKSELIFDTKKLLKSLNVDSTEPTILSKYINKEGHECERWMLRIPTRELKYCWKDMKLKLMYKEHRLRNLFKV